MESSHTPILLDQPVLVALDFLSAEPLVPRERHVEIGERVGHDGSVERALDEDAVRAAIEHLVEREGVEAIAIDFAGTDGPVRGSINVPMCYTRAQSFYVVKCLTIPSLPNNEGAVRHVEVRAPAGCILDARPPWPTGARHSVGHFVVPLLMGAFAEALPDRVQGDTAMMNVFSVQGRSPAGRSVTSLFFLAGGLGAMRGLDGRDATPSPSNMTVVPVRCGLFSARRTGSRGRGTAATPR